MFCVWSGRLYCCCCCCCGCCGDGGGGGGGWKCAFHLARFAVLKLYTRPLCNTGSDILQSTVIRKLLNVGVQWNNVLFGKVLSTLFVWMQSYVVIVLDTVDEKTVFLQTEKRKILKEKITLEGILSFMFFIVILFSLYLFAIFLFFSHAKDASI